MIQPAFAVFDRYYTPKFKAYCASQYFDGNEDVYYDDDAQVASAYLTAYEVTRNPEYYEKGKALVQFLMTGWQRKEPHGVLWHVKNRGPNTCTTAECGLAALRLAKCEPDQKFRNRLISFANDCCHWVFEKMQDPTDKLICDGYDKNKKDEHGNYGINKMKWTYNQGTPISLASLLYTFTGDRWCIEKAQELALAVTDRKTEIFDRDTQNMEARYYRDGLFFYQLLAEGFADYHLYLGNAGVSQESLDRTRNEAVHMASYIHKYLKNEESGLYFQVLELFRIDEKRTKIYKEITGTEKKFEPHHGERTTAKTEEEKKVPLEKRQLTHSLISCASAARIFFQTARLQRDIS